MAAEAEAERLAKAKVRHDAHLIVSCNGRVLLVCVCVAGGSRRRAESSQEVEGGS